MSHTTKECDKMLPKDQVGSPSIDEGSLGGSMAGGGGTGLKKGPWTSAEDAILVEYVKKHGEGNWNAVQKHSGLSRCGKSCRLRWANHLRPNLKKGAFTQEEENIIVELHARMGNKWARMAAHLPGRTDNEIKNYWNTRIKRRQRAGLPIYPANLSFLASDDNQQGQTVGEFSSIDKIQNDALRGNAFDIPDIIFDDFKLSYTPSFPDISFSNMLSQGFGSPSYGFIGQSLDSKRLQGNETYFPVCPTSIGTGLPAFENFSDDPSGKINLTLGTSYPYDSDPLSKSIASYEGVFPGSHALMNGNYSTSSSLPGSVRPELPSFQYPEADQSFWFAYDSLPLSEAVDTIQSPQTVSMQSECSSHHNSGLLEEVIHQSHTMHYGKKLSSDKSPNSSVITPSELVDSSGNNFCEGTLWVDGDPNSPLGYSAASVFNECTPPISGNSLDEPPPSIGPSGLDIMLPSAEDVLALNILERDIKPKPDFSRPDALLGSAWLLEGSQMARERTDMNNAIATLLGDDCCNKHRPMPTETSLTFNGAETSLTFNGAETSSTFNGAETSLTFNGAETSSTFNGAQGLDSYAWYNMPCARQMSEHP